MCQTNSLAQFETFCMQSGLLERLREPMIEEWKVKISLTFPVWLTPGLWDLQACQLVTTVHSSAPVFYISAVSFQCILYRCVLSLSLRCGIQNLEIKPFWFKIYRFTWVFSGKKENTHTLGNRDQTLNKKKQLLLSTFYMPSAERNLSHDVSDSRHYSTLLLAPPIALPTFSDFNSKL